MNMIEGFLTRLWMNETYWSQESRGNLRLVYQLRYSSGEKLNLLMTKTEMEKKTVIQVVKFSGNEEREGDQ